MEKNLNLLDCIVKNAPNYIFWKDMDLIYRGCNYNFAHVVGFQDPEEIVGKKDEEMPWGRYTGSLYQEEDRQILSTGAPILNKEVPMRMENQEEKLLAVSKILLRGEDNQPIGILGIYIDITDRKRAEEAERLKLEAMLRAEKIEAKTKITSLFASNMSHNVSPILSSIQNCTHIIYKTLPELLKGYQLAKEKNLFVPKISQESLDGLTKMTKIIDHQTSKGLNYLRNTLKKMVLEKGGKRVLKNCSIQECLHAALTQCHYTHTAQIHKVHVNYEEDFCFKGDCDDIEVALVNLLDNAFDAIREAGKGEIYISLIQGKPFNILTIKDTGIGISADKLPKLFEPYVSFKKHGTGVGLASTQMTMRNLGGRITCQSVEGEYTLFELAFLATE
jgi:signal transduction histidine kinase